jgi:hypothetical protein
MALSILAGAPGLARAQVIIRAPGVRVEVGQRGVFVGAPGTIVAVPAPLAVPVVPSQSGGSRPPTPAEFAAGFRPAPGTYDLLLTHPTTGLPVRVKFTLPSGSVRSLRVHRRELEFVYRHREVAIRFLRDGRVRVNYHHG